MRRASHATRPAADGDAARVQHAYTQQGSCQVWCVLTFPQKSDLLSLTYILDILIELSHRAYSRHDASPQSRVLKYHHNTEDIGNADLGSVYYIMNDIPEISMHHYIVYSRACVCVCARARVCVCA